MKSNPIKQDEVKSAVRERYGRIAEQDGCCGGLSCCGGAASDALGQDPDGASLLLGYSEAELGGAPEGANLGLGCGNPHAIASLQPGETVLDLGSGAGFHDIRITRKGGSRDIIEGWLPGRSAGDYVASASIEAIKP